MAGARILVVEDERIVSMDIQTRLRSLGYEVVGSATSGGEAITKAGELRPNLVLMDIMLDGNMDGIEAAEVIREHFGLPVIYLTAYADPATLQRAKVTEPFAYILKPFEERELHGHIEIALYKHGMEQRLKESEERYVLATEGANDGIWDWDLRTQRIYFSPRWKAMLGYGESDIEEDPKEWFSRLHTADKAMVKQKLASHLDGQELQFECEYRILCKDGSYRWMFTRGMALRTPSGKAYRIAGSQTDVTERKVYDPITALPNRTLFLDRVENAIQRGQRDGESRFAVLVLNLDDFGVDVDGLGASRDAVLTLISRRFQQVSSYGDTVARLEEDGFGIVLADIDGAQDAARIAGAIHEALATPVEVNGQELYPRASIGIALGASGYSSAEEAVRDATTAMHRARLSGTSRSEIFDEEMRLRVADRIRWEADLRRAIEREELLVYFQPIVRLSDASIVGFEALVRWQHPDGLLLPKDFVPLAEQTELIVPVEHFVMRQSVAQMCRWRDQFPERMPLTMSINLSAIHYAREGLVEYVQDLLNEGTLDSDCLKLEITETALIDNNDTVRQTLSRLDGLGVKLVMDDFGTGYSSLGYLHEFPIQSLKIDQSFVSELGVRRNSTKIVQSILDLGRSLELDVTAEGIETSEQIAYLKKLGCTFGQGYAFAKPMSGEDAAGVLSRGVMDEYLRQVL